MGVTKFELNTAGVGELLKSAEMRNLVQSLGEQKAREAGPGYAASTHNSGQRMICNVYPNTKEAATDNIENNTLLKVIGG